MPARISVAMATYNGEKYLGEQLDSLAQQTVMPCELVVCDDGSTDRTVEIVREFASTAPFPVHIHLNEVNLGYSDNFIKAAGLCQGDWIAFCDQDDVWLPNKFERLMEVIERHPGDELVLIGHTSLIANESLVLSGQKLPDFRRDEYVERASNFGFFCVVGFSMACSAKLVNQIDATLRPKIYRQQAEKPPGHDQWIGMLANAVGDMAYIAEPLAIWRRHENSLTRPPAPQDFFDDAKEAKTALKADPYLLLGNMAKESGDALNNIAIKVQNDKIERHLKIASKNFHKLARNLFQRGELYTQKHRLKKMIVFASLLKNNAYLGPKFCSFGWKSLMKDAAVTFGILG